MQALNLALVQTALNWEERDKNLAMFEEKLKQVYDDRDIIVLPEVFTTGFSMNVEKLGEPMDGGSMQWMKEKAREKNAVITGSLIIKENNKYYNRLIWMPPDGNYKHYDKRHLFVMAKEDHYFTHGAGKLITEWKGWKLCPLICFDLRFPAFVRNQEYYDAMICVANWPAKRSNHWRSLLPARAIENQCYVAAVNRVGPDGNKIDHRGDSCVIDPMGETNLSAAWEENILNATLHKENIEKTRRYMPFLEDQDQYRLF